MAQGTPVSELPLDRIEEQILRFGNQVRLPDDLTLQQGLELLLDQNPLTAAVPRSGKWP